MSTLQQALQNVGYKPSLNREARKNLEREQITEALHRFLDGVLGPLIKPRNIQIQKIGSHYRARYAGESACCFGTTSTEATSRLKFWEKYGKA
jgi:hypothetical protein